MPSGGPGLSELLSLGVVIAASLAAGVALGWLADSLADTSPLFVFVGLVLGLAGACWYVIVEFRKYLKT